MGHSLNVRQTRPASTLRTATCSNIRRSFQIIMILQTTLVVILFLSATISKPMHCVNEVCRSVEGSSEGSGEHSEELEMGSPRSGEGSGEFLMLEDEMGSGMDSELLDGERRGGGGRLAEEEEMTTESEMINNLVPRFDLEMGSGDGEELFKMSSEEEEEEEGSGAGIIFKIVTEEATEASGAEFRLGEVSDEVGSGDDSTENVRQVEIVEEIVEITTEVAVSQVETDRSRRVPGLP